MADNQFLKVITDSFKVFLKTGSRSNKKLKVLHSAIAESYLEQLGDDYSVKSLGVDDGKEERIDGRYIQKSVDITIMKDEDIVAGIGVKFVMQNYLQNSNNYFENMLGETVNIRCNRIPYFQIFILPERVPYYTKDGKISKWDEFSKSYSRKYLMLSEDNFENYLHTPVKTLLYVIDIPEPKTEIANREEYKKHYLSNNYTIGLSKKDYGNFGNSVLLNQYETFIQKTSYYIKSL